MALVFYSVVRRHMKHTGRYFEPGGEATPPKLPDLEPSESLIGWYQNPEPWPHSAIVFTDKALYSVEADQIERIAVTDVIDYEFPKSKSDVTGVRVRTPEGFRFLRASGSFGPHGNCKDAFSLLMVLMVLTSQHKQAVEG
ncbi:MAG: hypothetical protein IPK82_36715 [Polyangiaceae bacterium]|nr:hypothetical protein [Polyangiaceae bacterium]